MPKPTDKTMSIRLSQADQDAIAQIKQRYGIRALNHPYDELLLLIPKTHDAEQILEGCKAEMRAEVSWLPGLPLDCEGALDERYNK